MLIDTDVLIWCLRGNSRAIREIEKLSLRAISIVTRMELVQGCRNKVEHRLLRGFLIDQEFEVIALSPEIGHRADAWIEQFHLSDGVGVADCLIAATASLRGLPLLTANVRHFRCFPLLESRKFTP